VLAEQVNQFGRRSLPVAPGALGERAMDLLVVALEHGDVLVVDVGSPQLGEHAAVLEGGVTVEQRVQTGHRCPRLLGVSAVHGAGDTRAGSG
jgi:hypothetical protein